MNEQIKKKVIPIIQKSYQPKTTKSKGASTRTIPVVAIVLAAVATLVVVVFPLQPAGSPSLMLEDIA